MKFLKWAAFTAWVVVAAVLLLLSTSLGNDAGQAMSISALSGIAQLLLVGWVAVGLIAALIKDLL